MNWDQLQGSWQQIKGQVRSKWGKLTDDDVAVIGGKKDILLGKLRERYGNEKDNIERDVDDWIQSL